MHYAILFAAGGIWAGYNLQRISLRSKMGQVKYAMDFMERHKEDIPERSKWLATCESLACGSLRCIDALNEFVGCSRL